MFAMLGGRLSLHIFSRKEKAGPTTWISTSAVRAGLHQIENPRLCSAFEVKSETEDVIEDWRYVWCPWTASSPKVFLPDGPGELWEVAQEITSYGDLNGFNIHIVTATMLRNAGAVLWLRSEKGPGRHRARIADLKRNLASLRLALPPRYLNPTRNVLKSEVAPDHHVRLTNILHLHMARIILGLPDGLSAGEEEWMENWQQTLEASQDVVRVVEQWDNQFSAHVDPAICFIVFLALAILNLHRRSSIDESSELATTISQSERILMLFLEQFSSLWTLPRFLAGKTAEQFLDSSGFADLLAF
ncbi:hypothetical protein DL766_000984 [Monosporascus sp. MC13-8B]|uniref:Transcription factor domain-containing protein n=1 Tax=Monosporascus cannonballus TaxID=155416 RepID=A0ABY0H4F3_9PEZI|nr:hypothetical protein DL762_005899 [Monosporascus cannonballus]RYO92696.1 hypothetical protein DL763_004609 [Monosporascus cannonballus]RYP38406.1 hypothetical protein DL766_000984 [Monosporascus sp. MC13-8B]